MKTPGRDKGTIKKARGANDLKLKEINALHFGEVVRSAFADDWFLLS